MNKRVLYGLLLVLVIGLLFTGCNIKKAKRLECSKTTNEGLETYGDATIDTVTEFDGKGKPVKTSVKFVVDINKIEVSKEKLQLMSDKIKEQVCGKEGLIPSAKCEAGIDGTKLVFSGKGDFNDVWYNYAGEENVEEFKEFLESHEMMSCKVTDVK